MDNMVEELENSDVVRLKNLPFSAVEADVAAFFRGIDLGPDGVVICINFRGRSTGHAYVQFTSPEIANKALEWDRQQMGKCYVEVQKGSAADMQAALRMVGRPSANLRAVGSPVITGIPGMAGHSDMQYTGVVRMRGMPYSCTTADIVAFFKGFQIVPDGIFHCTHPDGRPAGEAYVEFVDEETTSKAMCLHKEPFGTRYVELYASTKGEMMTAIQKRIYNLFAGVDDFSYSSAAGQTPESVEALGLHGLAGMNLAAIQAAGLGITGVHHMGDLSQKVCIKMKGLPYYARPGDIAWFFDGYKFAHNGIHMVTGLNDRPTGEAFVEFASVDEAQRAMERNRGSMGQRYIELLRATKCELLIAMGKLAQIDPGEPVDPNLQLHILQKQAAAGAFGASDTKARNEDGPGSRPGSEKAAKMGLVPPGFSGSLSIGHQRTPSRAQGPPYRSGS